MYVGLRHCAHSPWPRELVKALPERRQNIANCTTLEVVPRVTICKKQTRPHSVDLKKPAIPERGVNPVAVEAVDEHLEVW